ncbi:uncharacterized protein DUF3515 [Phycicoccus duodecadis]|uniref:Uncharacterized protein DUF3515 n=1 Tax=Phycicoccus duodecadis TaxID=173053 RepID=A0A2N3YGB9_9MICO|nr:uncharacterized protein DUF3515 [Phycicoccus duodecadis]
MLSGCSSAVEVSVPGGAGAPACRAAAWPATVSGQERRDTSPASPAVAAWGDPALVARCGVAAIGPTDVECVDVDGQGWIPTPLSDGTRLVSFGTDPAVEVLVPSSYGPAPLLLPAFTEVAASLPRNGLVCR